MLASSSPVTVTWWKPNRGPDSTSWKNGRGTGARICARVGVRACQHDVRRRI